MSEKRILKVGYIEYPNTTLIYRAVKINVNDYPELADKSDKEIIDYVTQNAHEMKPINNKWYDSLGEELQDQDVIREKIPHVDSEMWAEFSDDEDGDEDGDDDDDDDDDE